MPFILNMKQPLPLTDRLPIILSWDTERLVLQRKQSVASWVEEFFLVVDAEGFALDLEDLFHSVSPAFLTRHQL